MWDAQKGDGQLSTLLNWYSYNEDRKKAFAYFLAYLQKNGETNEFLTKVEKIGEDIFTQTVGWLCRIKNLGGTPDPKYDKHIIKEIEKYKAAISEEEKKKQDVDKEVTKKQINIQDRLEEQLHEIMGEIEYQIDEFLANVDRPKKHEWTAKQYFSDIKLKHVHAKRIAEHYPRHVAELEEVLKGECEQLNEGYSFLSKKQIKAYINFLKSIIEDAKERYEIAKQISRQNRKPRTRKTKSPLQQTAKIKYLREHENLKSIPPTEIIGATQLWIYNVKYRTLGVYYCTNAHGFSMKGTTILNFDTKESKAKKLRKPDQIIPKVLEGGKVQLRRVLENIRAKEKSLTGRINSDTILLRALK